MSQFELEYTIKRGIIQSVAGVAVINYESLYTELARVEGEYNALLKANKQGTADGVKLKTKCDELKKQLDFGFEQLFARLGNGGGEDGDQRRELFGGAGGQEDQFMQNN